MSRISLITSGIFDPVADDDTFFIIESLSSGKDKEAIRKLLLYLDWTAITGGAAGSNGVVTSEFFVPGRGVTHTGVVYIGLYSATGVPGTSVTPYSGTAPSAGTAIYRLGTAQPPEIANLECDAPNIQIKIANASTAYTGGSVRYSLVGVGW